MMIEQRVEMTKVMTMDYTSEKRLEFQREEAGRRAWNQAGRKERHAEDTT